MPQKKTEIENPSTGKDTEKTQCHIHDKVDDWQANAIRESVCDNDLPLTELEGKYYCLFHLPTKDKDIVKFEQVFNARLKAIEQKVAEIKAKLSEDKQAEAKNKLRYNFLYVWFPSKIDLSNYVFSVDAYFNSATFSEVAIFHSATFFAFASFSSATFLNFTSFEKATFLNETKFVSTNFSDAVRFGEAVFSADVYFYSTKFSNEADFGNATFSATAYFNKAKFAEIGLAHFYKTNFFKDTFFDDVKFNNDVSFNSAIFCEDSDVFFRDSFFAKNVNFQYSTAEGYLRFSNLQQGKENIFDFQEAAFEKATRVSFHTMRLRPSWFVNIDSSKFVFTNCRWKQPDDSNINIKSELDELINSSNAHKLLTKTCWQLAGNHEESKSFPKASIFRQMANESKRLEDFGGWKVWSLHWWYWLSSFYGESPLRAGLVLVGILSLFSFAYWLNEFQVCPIIKSIPEKPCESQLHLTEAFLQSLATASFQSIEYIKPNSKISTFLIILEKIFAPLQAALLALAIRRKFMR